MHSFDLSDQPSYQVVLTMTLPSLVYWHAHIKNANNCISGVASTKEQNFVLGTQSSILLVSQGRSQRLRP